MSVRPYGTTGLPLDGFSLNFIFEYFPKICRENSGFISGAGIKVTPREDRCTFLNTSRSLFLDQKILQTNVVEKLEPHILCSITLFEIRTVCETT
jgi:hypothetical protein